MINCEIHPQEIQEFICIKKDCTQKTLACQKCVYQYHKNHQLMCLEINQISNHLKSRLIDGFKQNIEILIVERFGEINLKLTQLNEISQNRIKNYNEKIVSLFNTIDDLDQQTIKQIDQSTHTILLLIEMINLNLKYENQIQIQKQYQFKLNPLQIFDLNDFRQLENQYFENQEQYIDKSYNSKEFFAYEQPQRIQNVLDQPINFFCNKNGKNVFASDGLLMKLNDILPKSTGKDVSFQLGILLSSFCPEKLQNIFVSTEVNFSGIYGLKRYFYKENKPSVLVLDDYVPLFANQIIVGKNNSIWITILEKAFAKINGSYSFYDISSEILITSFFPCPFIRIWITEENLLNVIEEELQNNSLILLQPKSLQDSIYPTYVQLISYKQVKNPFFDDQVLLLQLKNPAGRNQYQGDWGFQSPYWTEDIEKLIIINDEDDGVFYMDFMNFIQEVSFIQSFRIYDEKILEEQFILKQNQSSYFLMESQCHFNIVLQIDLKNRENLTFLIIIAQQTENQRNQSQNSQNEEIILKKVYSMENFRPLSLDLNMGKYVILVKLTKAENQIENREATLQLYGKNPFQMQQIQKISNFKQKIMQKLLIEHGKCQYMNEQVIIKQTSDKQLGWQGFSIINKLYNDIKFFATIPSNSKGKFDKPFQEKKVEYQLKGKEEFVLVLKHDLNAKVQFQVDNKIL